MGDSDVLREAGADGIGDDLVSVDPDGLEAQADWTNLGLAGDVPRLRARSELRVAGRRRGRRAAHLFRPESLRLNQRALSSDWTIESGASVLNGTDGDEQGHGTVIEPRLYQLVRQRDRIADRTLEIDFRAPGLEAYVFTFG